MMWSTHKKLLLAMGGVGGQPAEYTATGNPLSFTTNLAKPLKSLTLPWTPSQSGSGDPSPSNVRPISGVSGVTIWQTGANLIDDSKRYTLGVGYSLYIGATDSGYHIPLKAGTYRLTVEYLSDVCYDTYFREQNAGSATIIWTAASKKNTATFTIPADGLYRFNMTSATASSVGKVWLTFGDAETEYAPYTGTTVSVVFPALGKNLFDLWANGYWSSTTQTWYSSSSGAVCEPIPVKAGDIVTLSQDDATATYTFIEWGKSVEQPSDYTADDCLAFVKSTDGAPKTYTVQHDCYLCVFANIGNDTFASRHVQLERGSSPTSYEPYTNTVYGGSLELSTGVLTVTHYGFDPQYFTGISKDSTSASTTVGKLDFAINVIPTLKNTKVISTRFSTAIASGNPGRMVIPNARNALFFVVATSELESVDAAGLKKWFVDHPTVFVYEMATPQTIQLTPTEITALVGDNVLWSDTNGQNSAVYFKRG